MTVVVQRRALALPVVPPELVGKPVVAVVDCYAGSVDVALGRWTWDLVAGGVGSVSSPIVPLVSVLAVGGATLLVSNLLAGGPGWAAGRVPPAEVLRSE